MDPVSGAFPVAVSHASAFSEFTLALGSYHPIRLSLLFLANQEASTQLGRTAYIGLLASRQAFHPRTLSSPWLLFQPKNACLPLATGREGLGRLLPRPGVVAQFAE